MHKLEVTRELKEIIHAHGHENILSINRTTFEITKDAHMTKRGDCIIAVNADKAAPDLSTEFRNALQDKNANLTIKIEVDEESETVRAQGASQLVPTHPTDLVVRKSDYISDRTLAIHADKAAKDFSRTLVRKLQNPQQMVTITLTVKPIT